MLMKVVIQYKKDLISLLSRIHFGTLFSYQPGFLIIWLFHHKLTILLYHSVCLSSYIRSQPSSLQHIMGKESQKLVASSASTRYQYNKSAFRQNSHSEVSEHELPDQLSSRSNYSTNSTWSCIQLEVPDARLSSSRGGSTRSERLELTSFNPGKWTSSISVILVTSRYTIGNPVVKPSRKLTKNPMQLVQLILVPTMPRANGVELSLRLKWNSP